MILKNKINKNVSLLMESGDYPNFPYSKDSKLYNDLLDLLVSFGCNRENPFSEYVSSGQVALIKPNWVRDINPLGFDYSSLITHPSIIKYVIDFIVKAMDGKGTIIIGDAPLQNCNLDNLKKIINLDSIIEEVKENNPLINIYVQDWRITKIINSSENGHTYKKDESVLDDYKIVDLGKKSFLEDISHYADKFRVTKYKNSLMIKHHSKGMHQYLVTNNLFKTDFIVNIPKMKTHIKTGLTGAMKNMVGVNGHKEFLPHHIKGSYFDGGDNYCNSSYLKKIYEDLYDYFWENMDDMSKFKRKFYLNILRFIWYFSGIFDKYGDISAGSWRGNDTIWRTVIDLNHIVYNQDRKFKILNIVDGVISGESEGPLEPEPKKTNVIMVGENPAFVDAVIAKLMGYSISRIPSVYNAINDRRSMFSDDINDDFITQKLNNKFFKVSIDNIDSLDFKKPKYWRGA